MCYNIYVTGVEKKKTRGGRKKRKRPLRKHNQQVNFPQLGKNPEKPSANDKLFKPLNVTAGDSEKAVAREIAYKLSEVIFVLFFSLCTTSYSVLKNVYCVWSFHPTFSNSLRDCLASGTVQLSANYISCIVSHHSVTTKLQNYTNHTILWQHVEQFQLFLLFILSTFFFDHPHINFFLKPVKDYADRACCGMHWLWKGN